MPKKEITIVATHFVKPGMETEFKQWLKKIIVKSKNYNGFIDSKLIEPVDNKTEEFLSIFRYESLEELQTWMSSKDYNEMISEVDELVFQPSIVNPYRSFEFWFDPNARPITKVKMSFVTLVGLLPLVHYIPAFLENYVTFRGFSFTLLSTGIIVIIMSYGMMPLLISITGRFTRLD